MIGNVYRGDGVRGLLDYLASKDGAALLSTNLDGVTPKEFSRQFSEVRALYPRDHVAKPVAHIPFRPSPGEDLSDEQWQEVLELALDRLGYGNSPYVAYLHDHGEGRHLHIATYRVTFEGRVVSDSNDRYKVMELSREIEKTYGLAVPIRRNAKSLTRAEMERRLRDPNRETSRQVLREALDLAASRHDTLRGFLTELHCQGISAEVKVARNSGALQGFTLTLPDGSRIKGSDLGKKYSLAAICNRHELRTAKTEGAFLTANQVTEREFHRLQQEGLAPDLALRQGSRRTLVWELPKEAKGAFTDLIATRLPHRFLGFVDELPATPEVKPDLNARARIATLMQEIAAHSPEIAPPLPDRILAPADPPREDLPLSFAAGHLGADQRRAGSLAERAQLCQDLSQTLLTAESALPMESASLRAAYHQAMAAALAPSLRALASEGNPLLLSLESARQDISAAIQGDDVEALREAISKFQRLDVAAVDRGLLPHFVGREPASYEPVDARQFSEYARGAAARPIDARQFPAAGPDEAAGPVDARQPEATGPSHELLAALDAAHRRLLAVEDEDVPAFSVAAREYNRLEAEAVLAGLLPAGDRGAVDGPVDARQPASTEGASSQLLPSSLLAARAEIAAALDSRELDELRAAVQSFHRLDAKALRTGVRPSEQDPLAVRELVQASLYEQNVSTVEFRAWAGLQQQLRAEERRRPRLDARPIADKSLPLPPSPAVEVHSLRSQLVELRREVRQTESAFLSAPQDPVRRSAWEAVSERLRTAEESLRAAERRFIATLEGQARQAASRLAFCEEAYFRRPSPLSERLWRQAEQSHSRASLAYEKERLRAEALPRPQASPPRPRRSRLQATSRALARSFEKQFLGQSIRAERLALRAVNRVLASTSIGRVVLQAAHPLRSMIAAIPGGREVATLVTTSREIINRAIRIYLEVRAVNDRLRENRGPVRERRLELGDLSNRSLALAAVRARLIDPPRSPDPSSIASAVQSARSAEAQLLRAYRGFRRGLVTETDLARAGARALQARSAVTQQLHLALGLPSLKDFTAVLGTQQGRSATAWMATLKRAGISTRALASGLAESAPLAFASGGAAVAIVAVRQLARWTVNLVRTTAREILRDQTEQRR
jgi:hypothetical protein